MYNSVPDFINRKWVFPIFRVVKAQLYNHPSLFPVTSVQKEHTRVLPLLDSSVKRILADQKLYEDVNQVISSMYVHLMRNFLSEFLKGNKMMCCVKSNVPAQ
jgi:hypothetical protein